MRDFGVARLTVLDRLDRLGVATVAAVRADPIGESVSVCTGKGASAQAARAAALAEALERYAAEPRGRVATTRAPARELDGDALDPRALILAEGAVVPDAIEWCRARSLGSGAPVWVPANAVFFPYDEEHLFAPSTTGLAAGATVDEAALHGLYECIERDAYARAVLFATLGAGERCPAIALDALGGDARALAARMRDAGVEVLVRDVTSDVGVPTLLATIWERDADGRPWAHYGCAARADAAHAAHAALLEAAQSRATDIQGAREDLPPRATRDTHDWFLRAGAPPRPSLPRSLPHAATAERAAAERAAAAVRAELGALLERLAAVRVAPLAVDLSLPNVPLAVARAIAPGLEVWAHDPTRTGARFHAWIAEIERSSS
jgi:thioglycine synthase